jgi:ATP-binding cassette subfamily F protein uup
VNYIKVENLSKSYGEKRLFENISFTISKGQKIALVARNGSGKTSLMNLILGKDIPDTGNITIAKDVNISYLSQNPQFNPDSSILDTIFQSDNPKLQLIKDYNSLLDPQSNSDNVELSLEKIIEKMDNQNLWNYETEIKEILGKFKIHNLNQKTKELSGGQKKRVALAKTLVEESDLIILDEPTNHLDIDMIEWLEEYLSKKLKSIFLVTHDRYFLDKVCDEIIELEDLEIFRHRGTYNYYLEKKAERILQQDAAIEKARNLYRKELEWMRRQPKARTTKSKARIDSFHDIKKVAHSKKTEKEAKLEVASGRIGKKILEIKNISKSFDEKTLIKDFTYTFKRGDKIGIVGENGCGKSTLLNLITEKLSPDQGHIVKGITIDIGYYNQEGLKVKEGIRVIDIVKDIAENVTLQSGVVSASQFLNHFGFSHNTQYNYFENLSGGEKRRLNLLITLIQNPNFLILDEPTNDLDIQTLRTLEEFLQEFPGCVLIVSHDRYFLDRLTDHIFAFKGKGDIKIYPGNYSDYYDQHQLELKALKEVSKENKPASVKEKQSSKKKLSYKEQREFEQLEKDIQDLESKKNDLLELMNTESDADKLHTISTEYSEVTDLLEEKEFRWLELSENL